MRGFTLLEVMVVLAIVGVLSASAVPSIVQMVKKAEGDQAAIETASAQAAARDGARNFGLCLDFVQTPFAPNAGPYRFRAFDVACPGEAVRDPIFIYERGVSPAVTSLTFTALTTDTGEVVDTIHFDRNGTLYAPVAQVRIDAVINGAPRSYSIYPAAGTISFDEVN